MILEGDIFTGVSFVGGTYRGCVYGALSLIIVVFCFGGARDITSLGHAMVSVPLNADVRS